MRPVTSEELLAQLREVVALLAATATDQVRWLRDHRVPVDELALQLNDTMAWLDRLEQEQLLDSRTVKTVSDLDEALSSFSGPGYAHLWTEPALGNAPEWQQVRMLGNEALSGLSGH